jgi:hypothetical protein
MLPATLPNSCGGRWARLDLQLAGCSPRFTSSNVPRSQARLMLGAAVS